MMLADLGAAVIKVESLDSDHGRVGGVLSDLPEGVNAYFEGMNRNKRGIALDLKNPKGREIVRKLAAKSDVFVENFRKGVPRRLGSLICGVPCELRSLPTLSVSRAWGISADELSGHSTLRTRASP